MLDRRAALPQLPPFEAHGVIAPPALVAVQCTQFGYSIAA
jgi:hypothetical protein